MPAVKPADCFGYVGSGAVVRQLCHAIAQAAQPVAPTYVAALADSWTGQESAACYSPKATTVHRVCREMIARLTYHRAMPVSAAG